jgi:hypothetical protein
MVDSVVIRGRTLIYCENLPERIYWWGSKNIDFQAL